MLMPKACFQLNYPATLQAGIDNIILDRSRIGISKLFKGLFLVKIQQSSYKFLSIVATILVIFSSPSYALNNDPTSLPLIQIEDLEYQGAFNIPGGDYGESRADYAAGQIAYNPINHSLFIAGHKVHGAIAEISIPALVNSTDIPPLNYATFLQDFRRVLNITPDSNPQAIDRITGLKLFNGKLIVNGVEFYDAPADNTHTTFVIDNASDISNSTISGYYELQGAAHIAGWMSPVPGEWQDLLGGTDLSGSAPNYSINGRYPMGPTAYIFDPATLSSSPAGVIPTTTLLDFSLSNPLYADFNNYQNANYNILALRGTTGSGHTFEDADADVGNNDLWTQQSEVGYGFIVPGSRTYMTLGASGGHESGIGYKATQNNGNLCGGPCPYDAADYYNYYWLWDVNDLLAVKNGTKQPYEVRPYAYGIFDVPFQTDIYSGGTPEHHPVRGGAYDPVSGRLYLTLYDAGSTTRYARIPLVVVYQLSELVVSPRTAPSNLTAEAVASNQINLSWLDNSSNEDGFTIELSPNDMSNYSELARVTANVTSYSSTDLSSATTYYYRVFSYNTAGDSAYSNSTNAITLDQVTGNVTPVITPPPPQTVIVEETYIEPETATLTDSVVPVITLIGDNPQTVILGNAYIELGATASDDFDGEISTLISIDPLSVDASTVGTYSVIYNVSDTAGNTAELTRTINVVAAPADGDQSDLNSGGATALSPWMLLMLVGIFIPHYLLSRKAADRKHAYQINLP